jgi:uncharacterized protein YndB with AHSA1/START domain
VTDVISYRFEEIIARPPEAVWAYAADILSHPEWMNVLEAEVVSGDPVHVGAVGRESVRVGPKTYPLELTVSAAEPGRVIGWRFDGGPMAGDALLELERVDGGTRATWSGEIRLKGLWRLLEPVMAREVKSGEASELARPRRKVEAAAARESTGAQAVPAS